MRTFRCIYTTCFNRLRFLAENNTKLQKMKFFRQFKDHNLARKHGSQTNGPVFSSSFSAPFVTFIFVFENNQNLFSCAPPLCSILVCKIFNKCYQFGQPIILFQKVNNLRLMKIRIIFCPPRGAKKKLSAHELIVVVRESKCTEKFLPNRKSFYL